MNKLEELVPPVELCKLIPEGEFEDAAFAWHYTDMVGFVCRTSGCEQVSGKQWQLVQSNASRIIRARKRGEQIYPAPTLEEILEELHKNQEDVFLKWSPKAYHSWLVNAYTHDKEDYQDHNSSAVTAALKVWLKLNKKGN